jgi:hypothetical protein
MSRIRMMGRFPDSAGLAIGAVDLSFDLDAEVNSPLFIAPLPRW